MFLVDTNVLRDLVTEDPACAAWSVAELETSALLGPLALNFPNLALRMPGEEYNQGG